MKNAILFFSIIILLGCTSKNLYRRDVNKLNIVDFNQSYESLKSSIDFKAYEKYIKEKTIYIADDKVISHDSFLNFLDNSHVKNHKILTDSIDIIKMKYSF